MLKSKCFNGIITRNLLMGTHPKILNKPKESKYVQTMIDTPNDFLYRLCTIPFDINTRVITVVGNCGVEKEKVAKKIADYFAMNYIDDVKDSDLYSFLNEKGTVDLVQYNCILPTRSRIYTRKMLWEDDNPIKNGRPLILQLHHFYWRHYIYCRAMAHLFLTGKGKVFKYSPWFDNIIALSLKESGLMSPQAYKIYNMIRCEAITSIWKPHFIVYVKATPDVIRNNLKKKNSFMKDASNFSNKYIETFQDIVENKFLANEKAYSKVFTIDLNEYNIDDDDDFNFLMESMAQLNVDWKEIDEFDNMFINWREGTQNTIAFHCNLRHFLNAKSCYSRNFPYHRIPRSISEGSYTEDEISNIHELFQRDERIKSGGMSKNLTWFETLVPKVRYNYNNPMNQPYHLLVRAFE